MVTNSLQKSANIAQRNGYSRCSQSKTFKFSILRGMEIISKTLFFPMLRCVCFEVHKNISEVQKRRLSDEKADSLEHAGFEGSAMVGILPFRWYFLFQKVLSQ